MTGVMILIKKKTPHLDIPLVIQNLTFGAA